VATPTRAPRFSLQLPVHYRPVGRSEWSDGTTENISRSGLLFRTAAIVEVDTPIEMRVVLPVGRSPELFAEVVCTGRVVRTVGASGADTRPGVAAAITEYRLEPGKRETRDS
jgi:PilZ domain-containing protein